MYNVHMYVQIVIQSTKEQFNRFNDARTHRIPKNKQVLKYHRNFIKFVKHNHFSLTAKTCPFISLVPTENVYSFVKY